CLQKDPMQRLQAIGDWQLLLEDAAEATSQPRSSAPWALAAAFALVAAVALWAPWRRVAPDSAQSAMRLDVDLGMAVAPTNLGPDAILSPDGTRLVVVAEGANGKSRLLTRRLDQSQSQSVERARRLQTTTKPASACGPWRLTPRRSYWNAQACIRGTCPVDTCCM